MFKNHCHCLKKADKSMNFLPKINIMFRKKLQEHLIMRLDLEG